MITDTFDFVNKVSEIDFNTEKYMVSFDVESLFTNVPTDETIIIKEAFPWKLKTFQRIHQRRT